MKFIIYGVGAIGGTFAARLVESGQSVAGIARGAQLETLQANGLLLRTPEGDIYARFPVASDPTELDIGENDVIFLTVKGQDTEAALARLRLAGVSHQPIVCAQNGVANERLALRFFPNVYAMMIAMPATFIRPGEVAAFGTPHSGICDIGRYPTGEDDATTSIAAALTGAGFATFVTAQPMKSKHHKLLLNLGNVIDAAIGKGASETEIFKAARAEGGAVYRAAGIDFGSGSLDAGRSALMQDGVIAGADRVGSSSAQSLARGTGSIETDYLNGEIVLLGRLHGVPVPVNAGLVALGQKLVSEKLQPGSMSLEQVSRFLETQN